MLCISPVSRYLNLHASCAPLLFWHREFDVDASVIGFSLDTVMGAHKGNILVVWYLIGCTLLMWTQRGWTSWRRIWQWQRAHCRYQWKIVPWWFYTAGVVLNVIRLSRQTRSPPCADKRKGARNPRRWTVFIFVCQVYTCEFQVYTCVCQLKKLVCQL
jgi:hypothetical protein